MRGSFGQLVVKKVRRVEAGRYASAELAWSLHSTESCFRDPHFSSLSPRSSVTPDCEGGATLPRSNENVAGTVRLKQCRSRLTFGYVI